MTSTPVSLDESLNGSWIDINSASQIHSPVDNDSPEYRRPPHSLAESVQNLGIISFQVERFLRETQKHNGNDNNIGNINNGNQQSQIVDNISDMYLSDSDVSVEGLQEGKALIDKLREHHKQGLPEHINNNGSFLNQMSPETLGNRISKSGECLLDQVSDSLSILSRASFMGDNGYHHRFDIEDPSTTQFEDLDWLWDWTAQPEYFTGQEWKVCGSKQAEYFLKRKEGQNCSGQGDNGENIQDDMISLLVLTNILSIIIGAGLTYSILMRRPVS